MATFNCATCQILMDWWKMMSVWHYHCSYKLIELKLHNNFSYIVVIELHKLHMYMVSHTLNSSITIHAIFQQHSHL